MLRRVRPPQQPRQIEFIILSTYASSRSIAELLPISEPFMGPSPMPDDESAVPKELVPGEAALLPNAPPVTDMCGSIPLTLPWPIPDDESAVPEELVPGVAAVVPKAPPVTDMFGPMPPCDPVPPPRASAAVVERPMQRVMQSKESVFILRLLRTRST
jgi:hypothetical protein